MDTYIDQNNSIENRSGSFLDTDHEVSKIGSNDPSHDSSKLGSKDPVHSQMQMDPDQSSDKKDLIWIMKDLNDSHKPGSKDLDHNNPEPGSKDLDHNSP